MLDHLLCVVLADVVTLFFDDGGGGQCSVKMVHWGRVCWLVSWLSCAFGFWIVGSASLCLLGCKPKGFWGGV